MADNPLATPKKGPGRPPKKIEKVVEKVIEKVEVAEVLEQDLKDDDSITLTGEELKALKQILGKSKASSQEDFADKLVSKLTEVIDNLGKPHKSDAEKENDKRQNDQMRRSAMTKARNVAFEQMYCQHMAGTNRLSDVPSPANAFTAIAWHDISKNLCIGVCTVCQREFWPSDTDYRYWRTKKSFNQKSGSGLESIDAQQFEAEQRPQPFGTVIGTDPAEVIRGNYMPKF
jgi:hypothetical protein